MEEIKTKLINRLEKTTKNLIAAQESFLKFGQLLSKGDKEAIKSQTTQGINLQKEVELRGFEFAILCNILKEDFSVDFKTELSETTSKIYFDSVKQLEEVAKNSKEIPEELKKLLNLSKS